MSNDLQDKPVRHSRRSVLKGIALSGAALAVPAAVQQAAAAMSQPNLTVTATSDALAIEFRNTGVGKATGSLVEATVHNMGDKAVQLRNLSSAKVMIDNHIYSLDERLAQSPITVEPGGSYSVWLTPSRDTGAQTYNAVVHDHQTRQTTIPVKVLLGRTNEQFASYTTTAQATIA